MGEDVENVIGGSGNDTLVGNSPDPIYLEAPVVEPEGANVSRAARATTRLTASSARMS